MQTPPTVYASDMQIGQMTLQCKHDDGRLRGRKHLFCAQSVVVLHGELTELSSAFQTLYLGDRAEHNLNACLL